MPNHDEEDEAVRAAEHREDQLYRDQIEEEAQLDAAAEAEEKVRLDAATEAALDDTRALMLQAQHRVIGDHAKKPYPHGHGCQGCFEAKRCAVCGTSVGPISTGGVAHCTNGRCIACHTKHCTSGGVTGPGHGYGPALT